jgi:ribosome biogenesis GTPase / thiamine phosphate phosphatase
MTGLVLTGSNSIFTVRAGEERLTCRIKGKTLDLPDRSYNPLAPGDVVDLGSVDTVNGSASIIARHPRTSEFGRFNRKRAAIQTLGANIDQVVCLMSTKSPGFRTRFVDRVAVLAEYYDMPFVLIVSKSDLGPGNAALEATKYAGVGYHAFPCSLSDPDSVEAVRLLLRNRRSILVGQSGVGKSSLINAVCGRDVQRIGTTSRRYDRGRHTTTAAILLSESDIEVVDTPGIRELDCRHVPTTMLAQLYRDMQPYDGHCALGDCTHRHEPGCAVIAAVAAGRVERTRHESYVRLYDEIEECVGQSA